MHMRQAATVATFLLLMGGLGRSQTKTVAERIGYRPDAKLLIVHADDLAVAPGFNVTINLLVQPRDRA